nr:MAG TPA: hypothetical protein [Caudoviricetes sp.]
MWRVDFFVLYASLTPKPTPYSPKPASPLTLSRNPFTSLRLL